jgi:hypothetical protein
MTKFALLKNVSFNFSETEVLSNELLESHLDGKVFFHDFTGTADLFEKMHSHLGKCMVEILNCKYDETFLLQAFYSENSTTEVHENLIIVKRKINENDSYTFLEFDSNNPSTDIYTYYDVLLNDLYDVLKGKYNHKGIIIRSDNSISDVVFYDKYNKDNHSGELKITKTDGSIDTYKYISINSIVSKHENDNLSPEEFSKVLQEHIDSTESNYLYAQKDFGLGILNCYYQMIGIVKNDTISKLIGDEIYGDVIVGLENNLNDDSRILNLDKILFEKITKLTQITNFTPKNEYFCNIYKELLDL